MTTTPTDIDKKKPALGFLWFAIIAFALMLAVWLTLFILAATHPVQEIPLRHGAAISRSPDEAQPRQNTPPNCTEHLRAYTRPAAWRPPLRT